MYFDLNQFTKTVLYIGGNDIARGTLEDSFVKQNTKLIDIILSYALCSEIVLCELTPHFDVDVRQLNFKHWVYCLKLWVKM